MLTATDPQSQLEEHAIYPLPQYPDYNYAVINNHRVIVDRGSHEIMRLID